MARMVGNNSDWFLAADWDDNMTYFMDLDWTDGTVKYRQEFISVPFPYRIHISEEKVVVLSTNCCDELKVFNKLRIYDLSGTLMKEVTHLPTGEKIADPRDVSLDPMGNILLSDFKLGTVVLSGDGSSLLATLPLDPAPEKMLFYQDKLYTLVNTEDGPFINVYKYTF